MKPPSKLELERVAVVGSSCSGKTRFAASLAGVLGAPHVELDAIHWRPSWEPRPAADFRNLVEQAVSRDRWVVDGNYATVRDLVWSRATAVVWLNYPFWLVFPRAVSRTIRRVITQEKLYSGNTESFRQVFLSKDSILLWVLTSFRRRQRDYAALRESGRFQQIRFWELRRPAEASILLSSVEATGEADD